MWKGLFLLPRPATSIRKVLYPRLAPEPEAETMLDKRMAGPVIVENLSLVRLNSFAANVSGQADRPTERFGYPTAPQFQIDGLQ